MLFNVSVLQTDKIHCVSRMQSFEILKHVPCGFTIVFERAKK
jgi:hypothetical protein